MDDGYVSLTYSSSILGSLTLSQILSISVYYASGKPDHDLVNEGQHQRVSIHHGMMKLVDILQSEVAGVSSSATPGQKQQLGLTKKTSANDKAVIGPEVSVELESGLSKTGKRGGRILVTGTVLLRTAMRNTDRCRSLCF